MNVLSKISLTMLLTAATLTSGPPAHAGERRYSAMTEAQRKAVADKARATFAVDTRIELVSAPFVGTPYGISPLGEGEGVDPDPRLRWDLVDCLTFVETSLALSLAPSADRLLPVLDDIRYATLPPQFDRRNHFVEAQWIPNNVAKGYLRSIVRDIAGPETVVATTEFSVKRWHERADSGELQLADDVVPTGSFSLDVLPLQLAAAHPDRIPTGTLLFVVRKDFWRDPTRVSHVGFVLEKNGRKGLRHASKRPFERVVDEPLAAFFERNSHYDKRPVVGFALYEIRAPMERIAKLGGVTPVE